MNLGTSTVSISQKIVSVFTIAVLLGSIATFPPYVKDDPVGLSENNILQNPEIKKIIELLPEFGPILVEVQATSNGNAIQSEKSHVLELIGEVTSAQLEMKGIKGKLAVLEHNPSKNSKLFFSDAF